MQTNNNETRVNFKDIIGLEAEKKELNQLIDILQDPDKFSKYGGTLPKGVLVHGPCGTGKTLLVRSLSKELEIPFYPITTDKIVFEDQDVAFERLKDVFELANKNAPSVILIDEIDSYLDITEDTIDNKLFNQLLTLMDGFYQSDRLIIIATTSHVERLPKALIRPGRFDKHIELTYPNLSTRLKALHQFTQYLHLENKISLKRIAAALQYKTLPEIKHIVNEVILNHVSIEHQEVLESDFYDSIEKVEMGLKKEDLKMSEAMRRRIAIHEIGHALMRYQLQDTTKLLRVSLNQRSLSLGNTRSYSEIDMAHVQTKEALYQEIKVGLSGLASEEIMLGSYTNGAQSDIDMVTSIAYKMAAHFGMSSLGPITFNPYNDTFYRTLSNDYTLKIDNEVSNIIHSAYDEVKDYMKDHQDLIDYLADALVEKKFLLEEQFKQLIDRYKQPNHITT